MTGDEPEGESSLREAADHAALGLPVPRRVRLRGPKRLVARLAQMFTSHQVAFNSASLRVLEQHERRLEALARDLEDRAQLLERSTEEIRRDLAGERARFRTDHALVEQLLRQVRAGRTPEAALASIEEHWDGADEAYLDLEDQHRGSAELIRGRLSSYVSDVAPVAPLGRILDVGTGRGEFLEVLAGASIDAYGVDTNAASVARARERGLEVLQADVFAHLACVPDSSLAAVTAFQVVEHLSFEQLLTLVEESLRVPVPGGLLILETPNPNNLVVGASTFYLDPTHRRPLPPPLLHFVLWSRGFEPVEVRYLNAPDERLELPDTVGAEAESLMPVLDRLNELLFAPYDYCVIGQRVEA